MSLTCITGGRLCDGCMACYDDPHYGKVYSLEEDYSDREEEYIDE